MAETKLLLLRPKKHEAHAIAVFFVGCLLVVGAVSLVYQAILLPIAISLVFTYLLYPLVEWTTQRIYAPRLVVVSGTIIFIIGLISLILVVFAPPLYRQLGDLLDLAPSAYHRFLSIWLPKLKLLLVEYKVMSGVQFESIYENLTVGSNYYEAFQNTLATLVRTAPMIFGTVVSIFLVPLVSFLFLQHFNLIGLVFYSLVPRRILSPVRGIIARLNYTLRGVIKGQVYVAATLGCLYAIGFSVVGLRAGAAIGIVCGIARLVPYLDIATAIFLSFIAIASTAPGLPVVVGVGIVILSVQILDGALITPRLVGSSAGLHPVVVICSIFAFSGLFGFLGVLVAIPTVAIVKECLCISIEYYKRTNFYSS